MPSLSMAVFGEPPGGAGAGDVDGDAAGAGDADGDAAGAGDAAGDGDADCPDDGPGDGSGSAPATAADAAQPATTRLAAANRAAVGTPIVVEGTGVKNLIHTVVKSAEQRRRDLGQSSHLAGIPERMLVRLEIVPGYLRVHRAFEEEAQHRVVGVIRLVEGQHGGAVGLFLEFVITLGAR